MLHDRESPLSYDTCLVNRNREIPLLKYDVTASVNIPMSEWFEIHRSVGGKTEYKTLTRRAETSCTCKRTTVDTFQKKDRIVSTFEAWDVEEQTNAAIIAQNTVRKQKGSKLHSFYSYRKFHFADNDCNEDNKFIVITSTQNKNGSKKDSMARFSKIIDGWWKEQEHNDDQNEADLSPQWIKNTTDFPMNKFIDCASSFQKEFELFPKPNVTLDESKARNESQELSSFLFENVEAVQKQMDDARVSKEDTSIFCKKSIKDFDAPSDRTMNIYHQYNDGDNSSVASSSSNTMYEFFEDMSILTNEDFLGTVEDKDIAGSRDASSGNLLINLHTFEDTRILTDDVSKGNRRGNNAQNMKSRLSQNQLSQDHNKQIEKCSFDEFILEEEGNMSNEFNDRNTREFYNGFRYEEGFSPMDELRLA
mmetsp:Transcript_15780/g.36535  ORF Transcript_15780/g.36535 Transcript_15780/m.36535 type:complete len:420 (-) Transcript_15780:1445-2704(-)